MTIINSTSRQTEIVNADAITVLSAARQTSRHANRIGTDSRTVNREMDKLSTIMHTGDRNDIRKQTQTLRLAALALRNAC